MSRKEPNDGVKFSTQLVPDKQFSSPRNARRAARKAIAHTRAALAKKIKTDLAKKGLKVEITDTIEGAPQIMVEKAEQVAPLETEQK